ncbi:cobalamin B12-binding domain protein [Ignisphaera aggregans DSM 17230]|uniref:Cobalamin B12-binding domain protein n=1 Tax=Ignisphaera aggregans (strain DSM 17230 / JCM 13409 / AQ1.S1) TaxID=583356 RepID=E0SR68_IGNAA|nr:cobalamin B12-binding domain protein [Ignisphaera aggregans DSM 17230]
MSLLDKIKESLANLDPDSTREYVEEAVKSNIPVRDILDAMASGMEEVGRRYERGEYFVADLIVAGDIFKDIMENLLRPLIKKESGEVIGRIVIGTVYGDIHDIGKNLVATFLEAAGFEVIDLGVDVPPEKFVDAIKQYNPDIVGISALLTSTMIHMKHIIDAIKEAGLRYKVKIIVGGAPVTEKFAKEIGADAYAENAFKAVEICKKLIEEKKKKQ